MTPRKNSEPLRLTAEEKDMLRKYRTLSRGQRNVLIRLGIRLLSKQAEGAMKCLD